VAIAAHGEAEPVLTDADARVNDDPITNKRVRDGCKRADIAVAADRAALADHGVGCNARAPADLSACADDRAGLDENTLFDFRCWIDGRSPRSCRHGMQRLWIKQQQRAGKAVIRLRRQQCGR